jgi:hypothetical protein
MPSLESDMMRVIKAGREFSDYNRKKREAVVNTVKFLYECTKGLALREAVIGWRFGQCSTTGAFSVSYPKLNGSEESIIPSDLGVPMDAIQSFCESMAGEPGKALMKYLEQNTKDTKRFLRGVRELLQHFEVALRENREGGPDFYEGDAVRPWLVPLSPEAGSNSNSIHGFDMLLVDQVRYDDHGGVWWVTFKNNPHRFPANYFYKVDSPEGLTMLQLVADDLDRQVWEVDSAGIKEWHERHIGPERKLTLSQIKKWIKVLMDDKKKKTG